MGVRVLAHGARCQETAGTAHLKAFDVDDEGRKTANRANRLNAYPRAVEFLTQQLT
jgi:hypothetical protein